MNSFFVRVAAVLVALSFAVTMWAQSATNPIQVALLRWYPANGVTQIQPCGEPQGLAFDGSHIWVACGGSGLGSNTLAEYNASDLASVRTVSVPSPYALMYDGANIWASSNSAGGQVSEVNAATGLPVNTISVGSNPHGLAFDGTNVWVANYGSYSVTKILASTGVVAATYTFAPATCSQPYGMVFDGTYVWVACFESNNVLALTSNGAVQYNVTVGQFPTFVAYDGESSQTNGPFIWVSNYSSNNVSKIAEGTCSTTTHTCSQTTTAVGTGPYGLAFDGTFVWVADGSQNAVTKIKQSSGLVVGTYPPTGGIPITLPQFVAFDGGNIWVSNSGGTVSKF